MSQPTNQPPSPSTPPPTTPPMTQASPSPGSPPGFHVRPLSALAACIIIARLTGKRLRRSKVLWVSLGFSILPLLLPVVGGMDTPSRSQWSDMFTAMLALLAVLPPLNLAPAIAEEFEDKTFTYLWSRPFPRWSVLVGKLMALVPVTALLLCGTITATFFMTFGSYAGEYQYFLTSGVTAMALGALAAGATCVGLGSLLPRHATAVSILYFMVLDLSVGAMPFSIHNLAVTYHVRTMALAGSNEAADLLTHVSWLVGLAAIWLIVAIRRVSAVEHAADK